MAGASLPARAAQWSLAPALTWGADDDSNRYFLAQGQASQSASVSASLQAERSTETTQLSLFSHLDWQDFFPRDYGRIFEWDVTAADEWTLERGELDFSARDADQSSLTTETTETGILSTSLHQRTDAASVSSTYDQSERRALVLQLSYTDIEYYGSPEAELTNLLFGYRLPSGSVAEQYSLSERSTLTASAFSSEILSRLPGADENETGLQLDYRRTLAENTQLDLSGGAVKTRYSTGGQTLTLASLQLSQSLDAGSLALSYSRSLMPYGTGVLVQRQEWKLSAKRDLTEELDVTASLDRVQNSQPPALSTFLQQIALVQTYDNVLLGLDWHFADKWKLSAQVGTTWTRTLEVVSQPIHEWRCGLSVVWTPNPIMPEFWP